MFVDASELGFAAVGYIRFIYSSGEISCSFLAAKSRTGPLRPLTISRLERQAAVLVVSFAAVVTISS